MNALAHSRRTRRQQSPSTARRRLLAQQLESRHLLAGDVDVFQFFGNVIAIGDSASNALEIRTDENGDAAIFGLDGTTVNGSSDPYVIGDGDTVDQSLRLYLGRGDDSVRYLNREPIVARRQNVLVALGRWCVKYRRSASFAGLSIVLLIIMAIVAVSWARLAIQRADQLEVSNRTLNEQQATLIELNTWLTENNHQLRHAAASRMLLRLGEIADQEPTQVRVQLKEEEIFPAELKGFAWRMLWQNTNISHGQWQADPEALFNVAISDDGTWVATCGQHGLKVWDVATQRMIAAYLQPISDQHVRLSLDSESKTVLFATHDKQAVRLDVRTNQTNKAPWINDQPISAVAEVSGDSAFMSADETGWVAFYSYCDSDQPVWQRKLSDHSIISLSVNVRLQQFGAISSKGELFVGELTTGNLQDQTRIPVSYLQDRTWRHGKFSSDMRYVSISAARDCTFVYDRQQDSLIGNHPFQGPHPDLCFVPGTASDAGPAIVLTRRGRVIHDDSEPGWRTLFQHPVNTFDHDHQTDVWSVPYAIDVAQQAQIAAISLRGGQVLLRAVQPKAQFARWPTARGTIAKLATHHDANILAAFGGGGGLHICDASSGQVINTWAGAYTNASDIDFLTSADLLLTNTPHTALVLWDYRTGNQVAIGKIHRECRKIVVHGKSILVGTKDGQPVSLRVERTTDQKNAASSWRFIGEEAVDHGFHATAVDRSKGIAVTCNDDGQVTIWRLTEDDGFEHIASRTMPMTNAMAIHPNKHQLVTGDEFGQVTVWDLRDLDRLTVKHLSSHKIAAISFSNIGHEMATAYVDGEVMLRDTEVWEPQLSIHTDISPLRALKFSPDDTKLFVSGKTSDIMVIEAPQTSIDFDGPRSDSEK